MSSNRVVKETVGHQNLQLCMDAQTKSSKSSFLQGTQGLSEPTFQLEDVGAACGAGLLALKPRPQAPKVEHVAARQAEIHGLTLERCIR